MKLRVTQEEDNQFVVACRRPNRGGLSQRKAMQYAALSDPAQFGEHRDPAILQDNLRCLINLLIRLKMGAPQEISLSVLNSKITQDPQVIFSFNTFGYQSGLKNRCDLLQRLDGLELVCMQAKVPGEVFVNLHHLRSDLRPQSQTGSTIPKIIERNGHASRPYIVDDTSQPLHVGHTLIFGNLEYQFARQDIKAANQLQQDRTSKLLENLHQHCSTDVHKQAPLFNQLAPALKRHQDTMIFKLEIQALLCCRRQQDIGHMKRCFMRPTDQSFVGKNGAIAQRNNWLKHRVKFFVTHQAC